MHRCCLAWTLVLTSVVDTPAQAASADIQRQPNAACRAWMSEWEQNYARYAAAYREWSAQYREGNRSGTGAFLDIEVDAGWKELQLLGDMKPECRMPEYSIDDLRRRKKK